MRRGDSAVMIGCGLQLIWGLIVVAVWIALIWAVIHFVIKWW